MLSALQHYAFCPRQCALIHLEQVWQENSHTLLGKILHEKAHNGSRRMREGVKIVTDLELHSIRLGLHGRADVVEFHQSDADWKPYPVEYKKGPLRKNFEPDTIQLCAQAMCLEEMLDVHIQEGAIFYGEAKRRHVVILDKVLRRRTEEIIRAVRQMLENGRTPPPTRMPQCNSCSLKELCLPDIIHLKASSYIKALCEEEQ